MTRLFYLTVSLNLLIFLIITPMWHGPDEQAHFAQVQYYAENIKDFPNNGDFNTTSEEILVSERLLGTERGAFGKNQFTHRPWYRLEYTNNIIGKYENDINRFPFSSRTNYVIKEATRYPPLFYVISAISYRFSYQQSLIARLFTTRLASLFMGLLTVYFVYQTSRLIFPKQKLNSLTLTFLVGFQPMFSFLTTTVNSDNLMNLLFTAFLYYCCQILFSTKIKIATIYPLFIVLLLGLFTKPHFVIAFPLCLFLIAIKRRRILPIIICLIPFLLYRFFPQIQALLQGKNITAEEIAFRFIANPNRNIPLLEHFRWTVRHTIAEVIPWYWGVFNWLGVTLPRSVNRVINRILIISAAGFIIWCYRHRRIKKWQAPEKIIAFLILSSIIYFFSLFFWDWVYIRGSGYSFGFQGRYYFPTIVSHMAFIFIGLTSIINWTWWVKLIGLSTIVLNLIGLKTLISAYYQIWPLNTFFIQVSQYKPLIFKYPWTLIWFTLYLITLIVFIYRYLTYADNPRSRS